MVGGKIVHGDGSFKELAPSLPPASPDWSPVRTFGGHFHREAPLAVPHVAHRHRCVAHDHNHGSWASGPADGFWGALGCSCFAF